jgi:hypothetical protein
MQMEGRAPRAFVFRSMRPAMIFLQKATKKTKAWRLLTRQNKATNSSASSLRYLRFLLFKFRTPRAIDIPEGLFTEGNEENEGQIFSLKTIPWLPSFPSVGPNSEGRSR